MEAICIYGGNCLEGQTAVQGSKNAALPVLAATLLIEGTCEIENCPDITDVRHMLRLMESVGCIVKQDKGRLLVRAQHIRDAKLPSDAVGGMRSSITLLGALLARVGRVEMEYPGGCVIGKRPIDMHLSGLRRMGVEIREEENGFRADVGRLRGAVHVLSKVSVGTTENLILAAVLAQGETVIHPAAQEPEIGTLCEFLQKAGADIRGCGTDHLVIRGVEKLRPVHFRIPADRIVAGTYLAAGLCAGGHFFLKDAPAMQMKTVVQTARQMGAEIRGAADGMEIRCRKRPRSLGLLRTGSYPGFPTDLQSPFLCALALAAGDSVVEETIFENRYRIAEDLGKMGARIQIQGNRAYVRGVPALRGAVVEARELRGGAAVVIAGAAAEGMTLVRNQYYIDRGYENLVADLQELGVSVRVQDD